MKRCQVNLTHLISPSRMQKRWPASFMSSPTSTLPHLLPIHANWTVLKPIGRQPLNYFASICAPVWVISGTQSSAFTVSSANNISAYSMEPTSYICYFGNFNQVLFLFFHGRMLAACLTYGAQLLFFILKEFCNLFYKMIPHINLLLNTFNGWI